MRPFDEYKDLISLKEMNRKLAEELQKVIDHVSKDGYHVTPEDRIRWDSKLDALSGSVATTTSNGLMSAEDKHKLDTISYNANFYEHPKVSLVPGTYNSVTVDRYGHVIDASTVTDVDNAAKLGGRPASEYALLTSPVFRGTPTLTNTPSVDDTNAITNVRFVKDYVSSITFGDLGITIDDINKWNAKWDIENAPLASSSSKGAMSSIDKNRLDKLVNLFQNVDSSDVVKWNNSITLEDIPLATSLDKGLMSAEDKDKLNSLVKCEYCPTLEDVQRWDSKWDSENAPIASLSNPGIMSIDDRQLLNKLLIASEITQEDIRRWNNKLESIALATSTMDGLMSANDKTKLDNLVENSQTITSEDIDRWNGKQDALNPASITEAGTMSADDKKRLDDMYLSYESTLRKITATEEDITNLKRLVSDVNDGLMSIEDKSRLDSLYNKYNDGVSVSQEDKNKWNESVAPQIILNLILRMQQATARIDSLEDHVQWKEYSDENGNPIDPPVPMEDTIYTFSDVQRLLEIMDIIEDRVANLEEHAIMHDLTDDDTLELEPEPTTNTDPTEPDPEPTTDDEEGTKSIFDDNTGSGEGESSGDGNDLDDEGSTIDGPQVSGSTEPMIEEEGEF